MAIVVWLTVITHGEEMSENEMFKWALRGEVLYCLLEEYWFSVVCN